MTEAEWLACDDPEVAIYGLHIRLSDRKKLLFICGCCRLVWERFPDEPCRKAVEVCERYAAGMADEEELQRARDVLPWAYPWDGPLAASNRILSVVRTITHPGLTARVYEARSVADIWAYAAERTRQSALLREMVGNPFRPVVVVPAWRTETSLALARLAYEERAFDRLPILADALEDAGCTDRAILDHLRCPGPHVRGCWVVDRLLGKD